MRQELFVPPLSVSSILAYYYLPRLLANKLINQVSTQDQAFRGFEQPKAGDRVACPSWAAFSCESVLHLLIVYPIILYTPQSGDYFICPDGIAKKVRVANGRISTAVEWQVSAQKTPS